MRNMMRVGVQQAVAMRMSGYSSVYVSNRYPIAGENDNSRRHGPRRTQALTIRGWCNR